MGKVYEQIDERLTEFIQRQHMFFVATAPSGDDGLINVSPKGLDSFRILDPTTVAYLDLTGSGIETVAHVRQNGRITIMFCAFDGGPMIVRLYGKGEVITPGDKEFDTLAANFPEYPGKRSVIRVKLERIADTCGYAVPLMEFKGDREQLVKHSKAKGPEGLREYRQKKNAQSLDGLPGLPELPEL